MRNNEAASTSDEAPNSLRGFCFRDVSYRTHDRMISRATAVVAGYGIPYLLAIGTFGALQEFG